MARLGRSLLGRVILANLATMIAVAAIVPLASTALLHRLSLTYQKLVLEARADGIAAELKGLAVKDGTELAGARFATAYGNAFTGQFFAVLDPGGRVLIDRGEPGSVVAAADKAGDGRLFRTGEVYSLASPLEIGGRRFRVVVSHDMRSPGAITDDVIESFASRLLFVLVPLLLTLLLFNILLIRRTTAAIRAEADMAAGIGPSAAHQRISAENLPAEVAPLAVAMNGALDRLEDSMRARNDFVGNVAHELRTPLATLKLELDGIEDAELRAALMSRVDRTAHVVTQLLELARLEHLAFAPGESFHLAEAARLAVEAKLPALLAAGKTVALDVPDEPLQVRGRMQLAELAIANLLDNAARHTPAGTAVNVRVTGEGKVVVTDNGPGIDAADLGRATMRFWRRDHGRSDSAGLGLAIVQRIMLAMNGSMKIINGVDGGARLELSFETGKQNDI